MRVFKRRERMWVCDICGASVVDPPRHLQFHKDLIESWVVLSECLMDIDDSLKGVQRNYTHKGKE